MPFRRANPVGVWCDLKFFVAYDIYVTPPNRLIAM
jgi:hypothetical protein